MPYPCEQGNQAGPAATLRKEHCMTVQTPISCLPAPVGPAKMHLTVIYNEKGTTYANE